MDDSHLVRDSKEIRVRIAEVETQLSIIDSAIEKELLLPFFSRRNNLCTFLDLEKKIFTALLKELKWVLYEY